MLLDFFYTLRAAKLPVSVKEYLTLLEALQKGDECVTAGGIVGKVVKLDDNYVTLQVGGSNEIAFQRNAVTALLPKGSLKQI